MDGLEFEYRYYANEYLELIEACRKRGVTTMEEMREVAEELHLHITEGDLEYYFSQL